MGLAGYKTTSMVLLIVLVALALGSPVFAAEDEAFLILTPAAACPGETVTVTVPTITVTVTTDDIVGGGISVAAVSPLSYITPVLSSKPLGLIANPVCSIPYWSPRSGCFLRKYAMHLQSQRVSDLWQPLHCHPRTLH